LAAALRYFAGGSAHDIMSAFGLSHTAVFDSVWSVVEAVNQLPEFYIEYPNSHTEQKNIAAGFKKASSVGFSNCAGAVDGVLIWILKSSAEDAAAAGIGRKKFLCGSRGNLVLTVKLFLMLMGAFWTYQLFMVVRHRIALHLRQVTCFVN
jgi:hypothetical protein